MSESKSPADNDAEGVDELAALREAHVRSAASAIDTLGRARDRLDDESKLRSAMRRERRRRVAEMGERVEGCLLYTSPSPRDKRQSRMPSSA